MTPTVYVISTGIKGSPVIKIQKKKGRSVKIQAVAKRYKT